MKRIISLLLCITMLLSSANVVLADEVKEDVYNTVSVEFSDNAGSLEKLQVMVKDDNVYANAEELGTRLGYDVSVSDEYVSIYNKDADENVPYGLTVFYYDSTKVGHMLFTQMVDSYEAPFETIKNENGVWIPLEYSLLLLNSSSLVVGNTIRIEMPSKNIIDIYMDISQNNQKYLFDWQDDIGISEKNESIMGGAAFFVTLFNGLIKPDGESWLQGIQIMAMDTSAYDAKYAEKLAVLFCTYSDDELSKAVDDMKEKMSPFNGDNTLTKVINEFDKEIDKNIGSLLKKSEDLKKQIDANNNTSIVAYNKSYQALENACDKADFFSDATELYTKVGKGVAEATSFLEGFYTVAEVVGFANEFKNQDEFSVNALLEFVENSDSQSVMSTAMKEGISAYAGILQTDIVAYSGLRWLEENYNKVIFDKMKLTSALGLPANLVLIGWDFAKEKIPFIKEGLSDTDSFMLSMYTSIFQADSFTAYQNLRNTTFDNVENITSENLYEVSQYCYTYLKSCYLTREAALGSLSEENEKEIPSVIEYQNAINEEIAGYLVQLKNVDTTNEYGCYGFLPEDNAEYLKKYNNTAMSEIIQNMGNTENDMNIYKNILDMYYYKINTGWDETEDVSYLFYWGYTDVETLSDAGYALIDLDQNGISELLVTSMDAAKDGMIYDLYTYSNGNIIHLATSGERYRYYLCNDNTIYFEGSGGASISGWDTYVVKADKESLSLVQTVLYDDDSGSSDYNENAWYYTREDCYDDYYGYDKERMENISETEARNIITEQENKVISIQITSFDNYIPQESMSTNDMLKKEFNSVIGDETAVYFISGDFDMDGGIEAFGITGKDDGMDLNDVKVYYISGEGIVKCVDEFEILYEYGGGYFSAYDIEDLNFIDAGKTKFLSLGGYTGQKTWLYGIKEKDVYQPEVSGMHDWFEEVSENLFRAVPNEGGVGYYEYYYEYDSNSGEFVRTN